MVSQIENNVRFSGQYRDNETGLYYNYYRDYDPETGRYVEVDPIGLVGGLNIYAYTDNNPVERVDPLGLETKEECTLRAHKNNEDCKSWGDLFMITCTLGCFAICNKNIPCGIVCGGACTLTYNRWIFMCDRKQALDLLVCEKCKP